MSTLAVVEDLLSPHYLALARFFRAGHATFVQMNAERLEPAWTGRFDVVTCIWLFHEMPPEAIERTTAEVARVLAPGGRFLFLEAAQPEDVEDGRETVVGISERFRDTMNEPYFRRYQDIDLPALFARNGLSIERTERCYVSKLVVARRR